MTKKIDDFLNIPHEDELVATDESSLPIKASNNSLIPHDNVHEQEATEVHKRALELQEEIADIARNVPPDRSARMFEVSGQHLKLALEASNSKEKYKLDAAKLKLEAARLKIDSDAVNSLNSGQEIIADRNELIRQLLSEEEGSIVDMEVEDEKND